MTDRIRNLVVPPVAMSAAAAACATLIVLARSFDVVAAQSPTGGLTIHDVLARTLTTNHQIRAARAALDAERGALVRTQEPFDVRPSGRVTTRTVRSARADDATSLSTLQSASTLGMVKLFRSGVEVASDLAILRTSPSPLSSSLNQLAVTMGVTVPLMQGNGGGLVAAVERAARHEHQASAREVCAVAATALERATEAYWQYRAAVLRAEIHRGASRRSTQIVDEITILIAADERPKSDLDLMVANAATKRVAQIQAERQIDAARSTLASAIGLDLAESARLSTPLTPFPAAEADLVVKVDRLIADSISRHDDLAAILERLASSRLLRDGAAGQLRPRVDLVVGAAYTGYLGEPRTGSLSGPASAALGPTMSVQVEYAPSAINSGIRGALMEADARYAEAMVKAEALRRTIALSVADAVADLQSSQAQVAGAGEAVSRARLALATVQRNFELGTATLFDRILAEDTVTNAELTEVAAGLRYATALADLQFARGVMIDIRGDELIADADRLLRVAEEERR